MNRRTREFPIPLLPPPGETGAPPPEFTPDQEYLQQILAQATLGYIKQVNRESPDKIPLSPEGIATAAAVIHDAIRMEKGDIPINAMKPAELKTAIKGGLGKREQERQRGLLVLRQLKQTSGPPGLKTGYDLAIPKNLMDGGGDELYRYQTIPEPTSLRRLIELTAERELIVPIMALAVTESSLGLPSDPDGSDKHGIRKSYFPDLRTQAVINRGTIASAALIKSGSEISPDPLFFREDDLTALVTQVLLGKLNERVVKDGAGEIAVTVFSARPKLVDPSQSALTDYGEQVLETARGWTRRAVGQDTDSPMRLVIMCQHFSGLPVTPLTAERITTSSESLGDALTNGKPHLWRDAKIITSGSQEMAIPIPDVLAKSLLTLRQSNRQKASPIEITLKDALAAWREFDQAKRVNPGKIAAVNEQISRLNQPPPEILVISPDMSSTALLRLNGTISADRRRLNRYDRAKVDNFRLGKSLYPEIRPGQRHDSTAAPKREAIKTYLEIQQEKVSAAAQAAHGSLEKIAADRTREGTWLDYFDFDTHPAPADKEQQVFRLPPKSELTDRLRRAERIKQDLVADPNRPFPTSFSGGQQQLMEFLEWRISRPLTAASGKLRAKSMKNVDIGLKILRTNPQDVGIKFWRDWILRETEYEIKRAKTAIGFHQTIEELEGKKRGIESCLEAASDYQALMRRCERNLPEFDSLGRWLKAVTLPETVANQPDLPRHLDVARKLIREFGDLRGGISFQIPDLSEFEDLIHSQRPQLTAKGSKKAEAYRRIEALTDAMRPAGMPGSRVVPPKSEAVNRVVELLATAASGHNPLIPLELTQGMTLKELIEATTRRTEVAEAYVLYDEVVARLKKNQELADRLRNNQQWIETSRTLNQLEAKKKRLEEEFENAGTRLVRTMKKLGLVIEDSELVEAIKKS